MLLKVPRMAYIADTGYVNRQAYKLKVTLQILFDPRYNPFEKDGLENEEGNWSEQNDWANYAYVPFLLTLRNDAGDALYHWENKGVKEHDSFARTGPSGTYCKWVAGPGAWGDAWLCWYEGERKSESGLGGWKGNKQIIGYYRGSLPASFDKMDKGEYVDMPPAAGWLELQIGTGVPTYDYKSKTDWETVQGVYDQCRWVLYKEPAVDLMNKYGKSVETKDMEHSAWLSVDAKERLEIDTLLGTLSESSPTALGQLFSTPDKRAINSFYRAGNEDLLERLLIGTVYSNYAERHNFLSGTVGLLPSFGTYTDSDEPGTYLLLSEVQRLRDDESEIKMVQFNADNYQGVKFDETV